MAANFVQYVVVRGDLQRVLNWPTGAIIAQACHASSAVMYLFRDDPNMKEYTTELDKMHKVVLEAPDENSLKQLESDLLEAKVDHKLWMEQPEDIPTCLVTKAYRKEEIQKYFKKFKLMK